MSSVTIIFIIFITIIYQTISNNQCDLLSAIDIQSATYYHSLILRVQPISFSEEILPNILIRKVLVREVIKIATHNYHPMKINDIIIIRINNHFHQILDESCWHLLRIEHADIILFLNETNTNEFDLRYPPIESTLRVRENIYAVINYETYAPQVIIKTRITKPILSKEYSLQCNSRGNPIPRLLWSKNNQTFGYYPLAKQCRTPCRIYSIQNKYQSILYFQSLTNADSGLYVCHAENIINHTTASVVIDIDRSKIQNRSNMNMTCDNLNVCHDKGQCIIMDNELKCLCNNRYFGEYCETNYDDIIEKQHNVFLLFKSRFLTAIILSLIAFILIFITSISCLLGKYNKTKQKKILRSKKLIKKPPVVTEPTNKPDTHTRLLPPTNHIVNNRSILRKESLVTKTTTTTTTTTNENDKYKNANGYCRSREMKEECFSLKINKIEEMDCGTKTNHLILSKGYLEFYQPDAESGLIRPLTIPKDMPNRYMKYTSSQNRLLLPRSVHRQL